MACRRFVLAKKEKKGGNVSVANEIARLKREMGVAVLAHYYVGADVQDVADYVGDSFWLSKTAAKLDVDTLLFCGVRFMGESAKLLSPGKTVLLPDVNADCPMAHMVEKEIVDGAREEYGDDLAVVCYVNSTVEVKSWSDVCVTSSNALKIVRSLAQKHILFIPDRHLGAHLASLLPEKHFILGGGYCPVHEAIELEDVGRLKRRHPHAMVLAHPECREAVRREADCVGSTSRLIDVAATCEDANEFIIATAIGVKHQMTIRSKGSNREFLFPGEGPVCEDMARITLEEVKDCLVQRTGEVVIDAALAQQARIPLQRMLDLAAR